MLIITAILRKYKRIKSCIEGGQQFDIISLCASLSPSFVKSAFLVVGGPMEL